MIINYRSLIDYLFTHKLLVYLLRTGREFTFSRNHTMKILGYTSTQVGRDLDLNSYCNIDLEFNLDLNIDLKLTLTTILTFLLTPYFDLGLLLNTDIDINHNLDLNFDL